MPLFNNVILRPYTDNPYIHQTTEDGLILNTEGTFDNTDSGEKEMLERMIACGQVIEVGPDCKYVRVGDDVYFNRASARPVPFMNQGFFLCNEQNLLSIMSDDLQERFKKDGD